MKAVGWIAVNDVGAAVRHTKVYATEAKARAAVNSWRWKYTGTRIVPAYVEDCAEDKYVVGE